LSLPEPGTTGVLVEVLLPVVDPEGAPFAPALFRAVREELVQRFGGLTAFTRAPALGLWKEDDASRPARDDVVVYEVVTGSLAEPWWAEYRRGLERRFRQERVLVRATTVRLP
jgi:hypothetical protein